MRGKISPTAGGKMKGCTVVVRAVIEIGAETTGMLVAAAEDGRLKPLLERRQRLVAARLGTRALTTIVEAEAQRAREAGAASIVVAIAPELKGSHLARGLQRRLRVAGLGPVRILTPAERGALVFLGATARVPGSEPVCVVEIGSAATTFAVGRPGQRPQWWASRPLNAGRLLRAGLRGDPPSAVEQTMARELVRRQLATLKLPAGTGAFLAGPSAGLLALLCGERIDTETCRRAASQLTGLLSEMIAARLDIEPAAARQLPALLAISEVAGELVGRPLRAVHGGLAEGLLFDRAAEIGSHEPA